MTVDKYQSPMKVCSCEPGRCIKLTPWALTTLERLEKLFEGADEPYAPVGQGISACNLLVPLTVPHCRVAVLFIEPMLRLSYQQRYEQLRQHYSVPNVVFSSGEGHLVSTGVPVLHVLTSAMLSRPDVAARGVLPVLRPDLIICDHWHPETVRARRLADFIDVNSDRVRVVRWMTHPGTRRNP